MASNVNVRGQAKLKSEVVTRITKGQSVTVLEEIVRNNSGPDEPSAWAKIVLPPGAHVWVNTAFIDASNQTVMPKKLNLRSGPGENYSVIGRLQRGDAVKAVTTKGDWTEIEPPAERLCVRGGAVSEAGSAGRGRPLPRHADRRRRRRPRPDRAADGTVAAAPPVAPPPTEPPAVPAADGDRRRDDERRGDRVPPTPPSRWWRNRRRRGLCSAKASCAA